MPGRGNFIANVAITVSLLFGSCKPSSMSPAAWIKWAEKKENGLKQTMEINGIRYMVMYKPVQYLQAKALMSGITAKTDTTLLEFNIRMEPVDGKTNVLAVGTESKDQAMARVEYYNAEIGNDIKLVIGKDTLYPGNLIYERYYNISPAQTIIVGFDAGKKQKTEFKLIMNDRAIQTGNMLFVFDIDQLTGLPKLEL